MKITAEKKKEIMLESFDVIKDTYVNNRVTLEELVVKMFKIDIPTAVDMWLYLLNKHKAYVKSDSCHLTSGIVYNGQNAIGEGLMAEIVLDTPAIKHACFSLSEDFSYGTTHIICQKIEQNDLALADELLTLVYKNKNRACGLFDILEDAMCTDDEISDDAIELLDSWIKKVESKEERAKLNLRLLDFMSED